MYVLFKSKRLVTVCAAAAFVAVLAGVLCTFSPITAVFSEKKTTLTVVMYHQISENSALWGDYVIPESLLYEDFLYMKRNGYTVVSVEELRAFSKGTGALPEKAVLITFDDGEKSFITKVLPLLKEFSYPATVAVVGSLTELYTKSGENDDRYAYLNWEDLKILANEPLVEIANHSYNMHSLNARRGMGKKQGETDAQYKESLKADFDELHKAFLKELDFKPTVLVYPYGIKNDILLDTAKSEGYTVTFTCAQKQNFLTPGDSLFELSRFNRPYGISAEEFFEKCMKMRSNTKNPMLTTPERY